MPDLYQFETIADSVKAANWNRFTAKQREAMSRSVMTTTVSPIPIDSLPAMQEKLRKLGADIDAKRLQAVTSVQVNSHIENLMLTEVLAAGRLSPVAQAAVLRDRAIARDNIGRGVDAIDDAKSAVALDAENSEAQLSLGELYFGQGNFSAAIAAFETPTAQKVASDSALPYKRGRTLFYQGKFDAAYKDFVDAAQRASGPAKIHAALWAAVAASRRGGDIGATTNELVTDTSTDTWPQKLIANYQGKLSDDALLAAARAPSGDGVKRSQLCEASFFLGQKALARGDRSSAIKHFEKAVDTEVAEYIEFRAAKFELKALQGR